MTRLDRAYLHGDCLRKQGRLDEAVQQCLQAIAMAHDDVLDSIQSGGLFFFPLARKDDRKPGPWSADTVVEPRPRLGKAHYTRDCLHASESYQRHQAFDRRPSECRVRHTRDPFTRQCACHTWYRGRWHR